MRIYNRQVIREGEGQASSVFLWRLKKCALILGKNALIVSIYELNVSFKHQKQQNCVDGYMI